MTPITRSPMRRSSENELASGLIVMYENDGKPLLSVILDQKKQKFIVLNHRGREAELTSDRLYSLFVSVPANISSREGKIDFLVKTMDGAALAASSLSLSELWSLVIDENRDFSCLELCESYFGNKDLQNHLSLRLALLSDKVYFKRKKEDFCPRSSETIEELKKAEEERLRKQQLQEQALKFFAAKIKQPSLPIPGETEIFIDLLKEIAADCSDIDSNKHREARDLLNLCSEKIQLTLSGRQDERAYQFLRLIGVFDVYTNLTLIRHRIQLDFSREELEQAEKLAKQCQNSTLERKDYTHLRTFTVDDSSTKDMDDAISIEEVKDGYNLGVHISDVASFIEPKSFFDQVASTRATSLYLSDRVINMLPEALSNHAFSLVKAEQRACISVFFTIDKNFCITSHVYEKTYIKVEKRYSYEEVDSLLESHDRDFEILHNITATNEMGRLSNGGMRISKKDIFAVLSPSKTLTLQEFDEDSPARSIIGELMVLANDYFARLAVESKLALVFRGQEPPDPHHDLSGEKIPQGPARDLFIRLGLKKSTTGVYPSPHHTLGLKAYCQATSPIRRYMDICNQRQIISALDKQPPIYNQQALSEVIEKVDHNLGPANLASRESKRFWLMSYIASRYENGSVLEGTLVRNDLKIPTVELDEVLLNVPVRLKAPLKLGSRVKLRLEQINPAFDYIRLESI